MVLFSDGQEGSTQETAHDFSAWTGSAGATVVAANAHHGSYSFLHSASNHYAYKSFAAQNTCYMRAYVKFTSLPASGTVWTILDLYGDVHSDPRALIKNNAGTYQWGVRTGDGTTSFADATINTGVSYCVVIGWVSADKTATTYIDGANIVSKACATTDTISRGYLGQISDCAQMNADCVVIDTSNPGTEAAGGGLSIPVAMHHLKSMNNAHVTDFIGAMRNAILKTVNGSYR